MALIYAYQDRGLEKDIQILDQDDAVIEPVEEDVVRVQIVQLGELLLEVSSETPTVQGSSIVKGSQNRLHLVSADLAAIEPGTYSLVVDLYDAAAEAWKTVDRQVMHLEKT